MHWINYIKHTASQCSIIHLAVWAMRKDFHVIFSPIFLSNLESESPPPSIIMGASSTVFCHDHPFH